MAQRRCRAAPAIDDRRGVRGGLSKSDVATVRAADGVEPHLVGAGAERADEIPGRGVGRLRLAARQLAVGAPCVEIIRVLQHAVGGVGRIGSRDMRRDAVAFRVVGIALDLLRRRGPGRAGQTLDLVVGEGLGSREFAQRREIATNIIAWPNFMRGASVQKTISGVATSNISTATERLP